MSGRKGRSGRPRLPNSVKEARGTLREGREAERAKTDPVPSWTPHRPPPPPGISGSARSCWTRIVPLLDAAGRLTKVDRELLAAYCYAWEQIQTARGLVRKAKESADKIAAGRLVLQASSTLRQLGAEMGITPLARSRVHPAGRVELPDGATPALPSGAEKRRMAAREILGEAAKLVSRIHGE